MISEFEKKIYYISEKIESFSRVHDENSIIGVELLIQDGCNELEIRKRISEVLEKEVVGLKDIQIDTVWDDDDASAADSEGVMAECLEKGLVFLPSEGQVSLKEPLVGLLEFFDDVFKTISVRIFSCENYRFPTLLKNSTLRKVGYFDSFPNLLMFVTRLMNEVDNYEAFKRRFAHRDDDTAITQELLDYSRNTDYGLPPTMCYYIYEMLYGQKIHNAAFTAQGKSFRYENKYHKPFERLWDFTIRETAFIGEKDFVAEQVKGYRSSAIELMKLLGLNGVCETATDPFFLVDDTSKKVNIQKMWNSKYELRLRINPENTMAVGSFNLHGQFLAKRFDLFTDATEKTYCYTGCIGIGLERMLFGFLAQYGCEDKNWPDFVKEAIQNPLFISKIVEWVFDGK